uniref:Exostosin-2 n=1 Tax=Anthurium amnicola TaxID=1678845 RepID=A0A1D1Y9D7_9ARAE
MAASEARTACQRMTNRCFVGEDAKRAPKLTCYPSSSSKQEPDSSNKNSANETDQSASNFMSSKERSMCFNLQPDTKWWLQLQPNSVYSQNVTCEQLSASEEFEDGVIPTSKLSGDATSIASTYVDSEKKSSSSEAPWMVSSNFLRNETEARNEQPNSMKNNFQRQVKQKADLCEHWHQNEGLMDWKDVDPLFLKKPDKACFDLEPSWAGTEKTEPWWHVSDKDELASLVAQKSLHHIENCDLPRPQKVHFCGDPCGHLDGFDDNSSFALSLEHKLQAGTCYPLDYVNNSCLGDIDGKHQTSGEGYYVRDSEKTCSDMHTYSRHSNDPPESKHCSGRDLSKAELVEALCHSQTRAREAEIAAQHAYNEKEHIVKLFFKQASHLFACKQWIHMLQLESLFLQLKIKEHQISSLFPILPWTPLKGSQFRSDGPKSKKRKGHKHQKCNICRLAVAFAVGFSLASAGLLLGWTLGCLLPSF